MEFGAEEGQKKREMLDLPPFGCLALANGDPGFVARFSFFGANGSRWLCSGSEWLAVPFCGFLSGVARPFFCLRCLSETTFTTRALNVLRQYPSTTTFYVLPILLLLAFCCHTTTHGLGLGLQPSVLHSELVLLQRRTVATTATAATATTIEEATLGIAPSVLALWLFRRQG